MINISNKKLLGLISLGSIIEYYDFAIFIYLAKEIGKDLVPIQDPLINLILSFTIFAIGALARPIGGLIFAHIGDTYSRNKTFTTSILIMAFPTLLIAFIPDINQIGVLATILLLTCRVLQGIAVGGEIPGSIVFAYETTIPAKHRPASIALVLIGSNIGIILASIVCGLILKFESSTTIINWRLAFLIGGVFGIVSYFLRKQLVETSTFSNYKATLSKKIIPIKELCRYNKIRILQLIGLGAFLASYLTIFTFYMPTYLSVFHGFPIDRLLHFNSLSISVFILASLSAGFFSQYFGRSFFIVVSIILTFLALWLFPIYGYLSLETIFFIHIIIFGLIGILCGRLPIIITRFFPVGIRYTGVAFVYNICFGVIGSLTQINLTSLIKFSSILWIPAIYILGFAVIALYSLWSIKNIDLITYPD